MMMKRLSNFIAFIIFAGTLTACSVFKPVEQHPLPALRVEYTLWWGDYTLLVAKEKGFFEKYGVNVEPVYYEVFTDSYSDLAAGQIDAALIAVGDSMSISRYAPIKVIGLSDDGGFMSIVARPEIQSIGDLRGKSIGTFVGTQYELMVSEMLKSAGMTSADVNILNIAMEKTPAALTDNSIQAGFTWEPFTSQAVNSGNHIIYPLDRSVRLFPDAISFRTDVIEQRPEEIRAFMRAWFEAVNYRLINPEETRQIAAKYTGIAVEEIQSDENLRTLTYDDNIAMFNPAAENANSIVNVANKTAEYLIDSGVLTLKPDINQMIDPQFFILP